MRRFLLAILSVFLSSACAKSSTPVPVATFTASPVPILTVSSFPSITTPTPIDIPVTNTPKPSATPELHLQTNCLKLLATPPLNDKIEGVIAFLDHQGNAFLLDPTRKDKVQLPRRRYRFSHKDLQVSPNHKWLAYSDYEHVILTTASGETYKSIRLQAPWHMISGWLDNEHLLLSRYRGAGYPDTNDALVVFNPFTGAEVRELAPDYPDLMAISPSPNWSWFYSSNTIYDPKLELVLYPGVSSKGDDLLYLRNIETNQVLTTLDGTNSTGRTPQWSPDGQYLVVAGPVNLNANHTPASNIDYTDLFSVNRNGMVTRLTYLAGEAPDVLVGTFSWSPDGQKIAFWVAGVDFAPKPVYLENTPISEYYRLAVLDVASRVVTNYCVPGYPGSSPVWSPEGDYLVVEDQYVSNPPGNSHVYLVDIKDAFVIHIADDATPLGWLRAQ